VIDNPASCEIFAVVSFLRAKNMSDVEIHRELCAVHGQNVTSEETIGVECSKMGEKMFTMRSKVFGHL
jgi:hypothetical protein